MPTFHEAQTSVMELAQFAASRGWLPATSGNLSVRVSDQPLTFAITRSGADKSRLQPEDVLLLDADMRAQGDTPYKPSAETTVHVALYQKFECGSILHVHTVYNNLVSELYAEQGFVEIRGHELVKALGHWEEGAAVRIPIVPNWADLHRLGSAVAEAAQADVPAVLVRAHGVYAWGDTPDDARRHLEAIEFLCEYMYKLHLARGRGTV
ncbi:methylthioribulose 1-phosphate dehydratase [Alicyclobacillus mali]|uniref:Methylthioribulose-1-phosphate dehydratase n=1 Tax=Alicyclobacillus mali (ex Roth et al. 2021) TaxID=1123961 RepID=A0ABS0F3E9_9BACL|nr:methylthioribulose 1-phosphate dehydratase [Alicyclobacillus mali (ex Roth et al. 2021)]MBF8377816.1 methylthioribulose 1-phosphate dehydratase [Alicyclobacillus mali (ex Roth et al. 2021)]